MTRIMIHVALALALSTNALHAAENPAELIAASKAAYASLDHAAYEIAFEAALTNPAQSLTSAAPFERHPMKVAARVDGAGGTLIADVESELPGGFAFAQRYVETPTAKHDIDRIAGTVATAPQAPPLFDRLVPQRLLTRASAAGAKLASVASSDGIRRISVTPASGPPFVLGFDEQNRIARYEQTLPAGLLGAGRVDVTISYDGTRPVPVEVRSTVRNDVNGEYSNVFVRSNATLPEIKAPEEEVGSYREDARTWRPARSTVELAPGVHLVQNLTDTRGTWSYNVMLVDLGDAWLVAEAPLDAATTTRVMAEAERLSPGKPIRTVVQSHHHHDHLGGVMPYVEAGAEIVTTPIAADLIRRIAGPDRKPKLREVTSDRVTLGSGDRVVEVLRIADEPHAKEMLVVHHAASGTLYQADLVNEGEYPANASTAHFVTWLSERALKPSRIVGLHGRVLDREAVSKLLAR